VVGIMQENIDKVMQRGEGIQQLRGKTGNDGHEEGGGDDWYFESMKHNMGIPLLYSLF
jgi:hypothetical protein